jgi:hypothetical protein
MMISDNDDDSNDNSNDDTNRIRCIQFIEMMIIKRIPMIVSIMTFDQ